MQTFFFHGFSGGASTSLASFIKVLDLNPSKVVALDMPGFSPQHGLLEPEVIADPEAYMRLVEAQVAQYKTGDTIRIIAYSHGAIPAFLYAAAHQDEVVQLVLICPASSLHRFVGLLPRVMRRTSRVMSVERLVGVMRSRFLVDAITLYGYKRYWDRQTLVERLRARREESAYYTSNLFHLMKQLEVFQKQCHDKRLDKVPTIILQTTDDEVIGGNSVNWFEQRIAEVEVISTLGGHAIVTVLPDQVAEHLKPYLK